MRASLVERASELAALAARMGSAPDVAVDVEGDGLFRYRARLCTVQVATTDEVAIIDTLAIPDLGPLSELLGPRGPVKVVHDASFDARLLRDRGVELGPIFDTALAVRFLGAPATGLAAVLAAELGVVVDKDQQQSDWGKRPLSEDDLRYLEEDVRHLVPLASRLRERVAEADIGREVEAECAYLLQRARDERPDPRPAWVRIKGHRELTDVGRAVLREVALVRESVAERIDVPPFKVVGNDVLLELARRKPVGMAELRRVRGADRGRARMIQADLVAAVSRGVAAGAVPPDERPDPAAGAPSPAERQAEKRRQRALTSWRKAAAHSRGVDPQVVLPGHCLSHLASAGARDAEDLLRTPGFGAFRVERYAEAILAALAEP